MRRSPALSGGRSVEYVDGRVKSGRVETVGRPRCTQKSVGIRELTPRISTVVIPYRDDSTKARLAAETERFCANRWEIGNFGLLQSVIDGCDGRGAVKRPAR